VLIKGKNDNCLERNGFYLSVLLGERGGADDLTDVSIFTKPSHFCPESVFVSGLWSLWMKTLWLETVVSHPK